MITKYLIIVVGAACLAAGAGGTLWITKAVKPEIKLQCPKAPDCNCPAAVELNNFDLEKINNKKGGQFHLHNTLSNVTIKIESKDSLLLKQILRNAGK